MGIFLLSNRPRDLQCQLCVRHSNQDIWNPRKLFLDRWTRHASADTSMLHGAKRKHRVSCRGHWETPASIYPQRWRSAAGAVGAARPARSRGGRSCAATPRARSGPAPPAAAARCRRALGRPPLPARPARQAPVAHPLAVVLASSVYKERVMVRPVGHHFPAKIAAHRGAAGVVGQRVLVSGGRAAETHNFTPRHRY